MFHRIDRAEPRWRKCSGALGSLGEYIIYAGGLEPRKNLRRCYGRTKWWLSRTRPTWLCWAPLTLRRPNAASIGGTRSVRSRAFPRVCRQLRRRSAANGAYSCHVSLVVRGIWTAALGQRYGLRRATDRIRCFISSGKWWGMRPCWWTRATWRDGPRPCRKRLMIPAARWHGRTWASAGWRVLAGRDGEPDARGVSARRWLSEPLVGVLHHETGHDP